MLPANRCSAMILGALVVMSMQVLSASDASINASVSIKQLLDIGQTACRKFTVTNESLKTVLDTDVSLLRKPIQFRQTEIGATFTVSNTHTELLEIQLLQPPGQPRQVNVTSYLSTRAENTENTKEKRASTRLALNADCDIRVAHTLVYNFDDGKPLYVTELDVTEIDTTELDTTQLDSQLPETGDKQWINPELPAFNATATDTTRVAMVDSGVNYLLAEIAGGLATDADGKLSGYDFWDMDDKPFDANPARSPFFVQRHGTRTTSIVLREAPDVKVVPYRYPRNDMSKMADLIQHADTLGIRVIGMPLGSNKYSDWADFEAEAEKHPHILFIVSAGNNGRDIDQQAVYPAAMETKNLLVVTSSDDFVYPAERTNYGRMSVDYLVPAERIPATDFSGEEILVSGSSYAVARTVALAGRILQQNPDHSIADLTGDIRKRSVRAETSRFVAIGYLGDPLASSDTSEIRLTDETDAFTTTYAEALGPAVNYVMPLHLYRLDNAWSTSKISASLSSASQLYRQCKIALTVEGFITLDVPDYLKDLATGHALTIARAINQISPASSKAATEKTPYSQTSVFFARDTVMQEPYDANAFGIGNTRNRPWMTNSLWLTQGLIDADIALAHELFHIASNSGDHSDLAENLMQSRTRPENLKLTADQCATAIERGVANGLLRRV